MKRSKYYDYKFEKYNYQTISRFPGKGWGLEKYIDLLPINKIEISLGEGNTPMVKTKNLGDEYGFSNLYVKREDLNPTGSYKDRGSLVAVSQAVEKGVSKVSIASCGNAAVSTAAYALKAGISCTCYIPKRTSSDKKTLIRLFKSKIVEMDGCYEDVYHYLIDSKPKGLNITPGANPYSTEGCKTISYEIWGQLKVPEVIVVPCGNGGNLAGIWRGFWELKQMGKTNKVPVMVGVQIAKASPLKTALQENRDFVILEKNKDSIAEGIVALESYCSPKAMTALKESNGFMVEVTDTEIRKVLKDIVQLEAIIPEPTAAAAFAALPKLKGFGIEANKSIVVINTGSGMKCLDKITQII